MIHHPSVFSAKDRSWTAARTLTKLKTAVLSKYAVPCEAVTPDPIDFRLSSIMVSNFIFLGTVAPRLTTLLEATLQELKAAARPGAAV